MLFDENIRNVIEKVRLMRRHFFLGAIIFVLFAVSAFQLLRLSPYNEPSVINAIGSLNDQNQEKISFVRAKVLSVRMTVNQYYKNVQEIQVRILDGPDLDKVVNVERIISLDYAEYKRLPVGSEILLTIYPNNGNRYIYQDRYRIPGAVTLFLILLVLVAIIAGWRGITSMAGLAISIAILSIFVIPRIVAGHDAYTTCVQGAFMIATTSIFIAHGFNKRATIAFLGAVSTLMLTIWITSASGYLIGVTGINSENNLGIIYATNHISLSGILFGGIIIASLGVLNDITIGQAAAVDEIYKANPKQSIKDLYIRGMSVGREHIAALVNTLALAYVGVALPSVITLAIYNHAPILVILNSETVMEEIMRTGVVSISMLLTVPVTTALAAYILPRWNRKVEIRIKSLRDL